MIDLAEARQWAVDTIGEAPEGVTIFSSPPENLTLPAYVVAAGAPWLEAGTYAQRRVNLEVVCLVSVKGGNQGALERLEPMVALMLERFKTGAQVDVPVQEMIGSAEVLRTAVRVTCTVEE